MYEVGHAEIAAAVHEEPATMVLSGASPSVEYFWKKYPDFMKQWRNVLSVTLIGFSSSRQIAYEQKVLDAIVKELGGSIYRRGLGAVEHRPGQYRRADSNGSVKPVVPHCR